MHRAAYLDYIGIKRFDAQGNVNGERRFIGLFSTGAYTGSVRNVPIVRDKVREVIQRAGFPADSHSGKDLLSILETYPRDELFQIDVDALLDTARSILRLQERRCTRLFLRPDVYGRFMSALVFLPRDRYNTSVRLRIQDELRSTFEAESIDFEARLTESALARIFFQFGCPGAPRSSRTPQPWRSGWCRPPAPGARGSARCSARSSAAVTRTGCRLSGPKLSPLTTA